MLRNIARVAQQHTLHAVRSSSYLVSPLTYIRRNSPAPNPSFLNSVRGLCAEAQPVDPERFAEAVSLFRGGGGGGRERETETERERERERERGLVSTEIAVVSGEVGSFGSLRFVREKKRGVEKESTDGYLGLSICVYSHTC